MQPAHLWNIDGELSVNNESIWSCWHLCQCWTVTLLFLDEIRISYYVSDDGRFLLWSLIKLHISRVNTGIIKEVLESLSIQNLLDVYKIGAFVTVLWLEGKKFTRTPACFSTWLAERQVRFPCTKDLPQARSGINRFPTILVQINWCSLHITVHSAFRENESAVIYQSAWFSFTLPHLSRALLNSKTYCFRVKAQCFSWRGWAACLMVNLCELFLKLGDKNRKMRVLTFPKALVRTVLSPQPRIRTVNLTPNMLLRTSPVSFSQHGKIVMQLFKDLRALGPCGWKRPAQWSHVMP